MNNEEFDNTLGDGSLSQLVTQQLYYVNTNGDGADVVNTDTIEGITDERDTLILNMSTHVNEWKAQREFAQAKRDEAKEDLLNKVQWPNRRDCWVGDYSQNFGLPWFGNEQPGQTYYYSPLGIYIFGMANYATEVLTAYVYDEGEGAKGGDNVASLIYKYLEDEGVIKEWEDSGKEPGESCTFVFDNCAGQNKNKCVIRMACLWLIDMGIYKTVIVLFLIAGHTKNICDRRFKDVKKECHHSDIFSMTKLIELMNRSEHVIAILVTHEVFYNWNVRLDKVYRPLKTNTTYKNHVFTGNDASPGELMTQRVHTSASEAQFLVKARKKQDTYTAANHDTRRLGVQGVTIQNLNKPGIAAIKQVEMYTKWLPLIKHQPGSHILCPKPLLAVSEGVRTKKNTKAADKRQVKRKRAAIGNSTTPLPLLKGASTITVSVYDNASNHTDVIAESNV